MNIAFAGTPEFAKIILKRLVGSRHHISMVFTQPDRPAGRGQEMHQSPVKQFAEHYQIPVHQPTKLTEEIAETIKQERVDLLIVVAYGLILPEIILNAPRLGCINVHASLLPRWRGAAPIQHAILAGDEATGVSIMQMDAALDTGPVFMEATCPIHMEDTSESLHDKLAMLGAETLVECLLKIKDGITKPYPQDDDFATYAPKIKKQHAQIDWSLPATTIARQVRAYSSWPVAFSYLDDSPIRIWEAHAVVVPSPPEPPGTILSANKDGIDVVTGSCCLRLHTLQLPNKKPVSVGELLNAYADLFKVGKQFEVKHD